MAQKTEKPYAYNRLPLVENRVVYTGVLPVEGIGQDELFARAQQWAKQTLTGGADTTHVRDKQTGTVSGHGLLTQPPIGAFKDPNSYAYTCTVYVKDGKYKYQIDQIQWTYSTMRVGGQVAEGPSTYPIEHLRTLRQNYYVEDRAGYLDSQIKELITSLDVAMTHGQKPTTVTW
ncbi:DUF4468 domain-containing protein [Hymenobacter sp. HSC-4F20]|uniref:DUF4468 domain-containing protein n=1 Tax=Hymenobacter sp. HSC-4F20 TaxID=2864135 RepID=UPI001C72F23F|nr:DUF4468 domain-containing protein [Hymenobacter sp. HSC-4F20]MBX0292092.1 DUF4468 domain-containing protein [Hymenobacter sp. HSC-4F20]